ncbi:MAG: hypothetical protein HY098_04685 [Nitrospinae bacterium]|nr:hypothetical protein [Nitrospinota bacterium]
MRDKVSFWALAVLLAPTAAVWYFSTSPRYTFRHSAQSALVLSFKHATRRIRECGDEESAGFVAGMSNLKHSQNAGVQCGSRERFPLEIRVAIDGNEALRKEKKPSGWKRDSAVFIFEKFYVSPGRHLVEISVNDSGGGGGGLAFRFGETISFEPGRLVVIYFDGKSFLIGGDILKDEK